MYNDDTKYVHGMYRTTLTGAKDVALSEMGATDADMRISWMMFSTSGAAAISTNISVTDTAGNHFLTIHVASADVTNYGVPIVLPGFFSGNGLKLEATAYNANHTVTIAYFKEE